MKKDCSTCRHENLLEEEIPCSTCGYNQHWEAKVKRGCNTCGHDRRNNESKKDTCINLIGHCNESTGYSSWKPIEQKIEQKEDVIKRCDTCGNNDHVTVTRCEGCGWEKNEHWIPIIEEKPGGSGHVHVEYLQPFTSEENMKRLQDTSATMWSTIADLQVEIKELERKMNQHVDNLNHADELLDKKIDSGHEHHLVI